MHDLEHAFPFSIHRLLPPSLPPSIRLYPYLLSFSSSPRRSMYRFREHLSIQSLVPVSFQLSLASELARGMLSLPVETRRTTVHLLGDAGVGKTTLKETMGRGYFSALFNVS